SSVGWKESDKQYSIGCESNLNNKSLFSALPSGYRLGNGKMEEIYNDCILWWSLTEHKLQYATQSDYAVAASLKYNDDSLLFNNYSKNYGCYIRCIKNL